MRSPVGAGLLAKASEKSPQNSPLHTGPPSAIIPPIPIREIVMRHLLCLLFLVFVLPASATALLENRPSSTLGSINNSADFLPVREAFQLSLVESTPQSIKLRFQLGSDSSVSAGGWRIDNVVVTGGGCPGTPTPTPAPAIRIVCSCASIPTAPCVP